MLTPLGLRVQLGKTKVFIKNPNTVFKLEEERDEKLEGVARVIQVRSPGRLLLK